MIDDGLAHTNPQNRETRSLAEIVSDIENDKNKSQTRKEFEIELARIANRLKGHYEPKQQQVSEPKKPQASEDQLPFREQIKLERALKS